MTHIITDEQQVALYCLLAGEKADLYVQDLLIPALKPCLPHQEHSIDAVVDALGDPYLCLKIIFSHYAFSRRGKDRHELSSLASKALEQTCSHEAFGNFLERRSAKVLWDNFVEVCYTQKRKPMEQLNCGVIAGMAELAQEIYEVDGCGSIARWVVNNIRRTGRIEEQFLRMVDVRGIGPKLASLLLRDIIFFTGTEELIDPIDRLYTIPIDKWMRQVAPLVISEPRASEMADWILAGKFAKYSRRAGVSTIRFAMGTSYVGLRELRGCDSFEDRIQHLLHSPISLQ